MAVDRARLAAAQPRTAVIAALDFERASLERSQPRAGVCCLQSGPGAFRAGECAAAAIDAGATALVSWGLAGALDSALRAGDVVLPDAVVTTAGDRYESDPQWRAALQSVLAAHFPLIAGTLLTVPAALEDAHAKAQAARDTGAVAVDMESAGIAAVAARVGARFAAVRIIVDGAGDALPKRSEEWIDERGNRRASAALGAILRPAAWPVLLRLARRYAAARRALDGVSTRLSAEQWCMPAAARPQAR